MFHCGKLFHISAGSNSAASITCSKKTGKYEPKFLARCKETNPLSTGDGIQKMKIRGIAAGAAGVSLIQFCYTFFLKIARQCSSTIVNHLL